MRTREIAKWRIVLYIYMNEIIHLTSTWKREINNVSEFIYMYMKNCREKKKRNIWVLGQHAQKGSMRESQFHSL